MLTNIFSQDHIILYTKVSLFSINVLLNDAISEFKISNVVTLNYLKTFSTPLSFFHLSSYKGKSMSETNPYKYFMYCSAMSQQSSICYLPIQKVFWYIPKKCNLTKRKQKN